jgi:hypothetical protein
MPNAKHDVIRSFTVVDELPTGAPRASVLEDSLLDVKEQAPGRFVCIAEYTTPAAASGAATNLRRRHGADSTVDGWTFATRKLQNGRHGLFIHWDDTSIIAGRLEEQLKQYEAYKKEQSVKAKEAAAKKAAAKVKENKVAAVK